MRITASTIKQFLCALPADRRRTVEAMRTVILENIDTPFAEVVQNGAIGYVVPHSVYPAGYHCAPASRCRSPGPRRRSITSGSTPSV